MQFANRRKGRIASTFGGNLRGSPGRFALRCVLLAMVAVAASGCIWAAAAAVPDIPAIMRLTVDSWVAPSQAGDFLPYGFDFMTDQPIEPDRISPANLIRQATAAAALANYYDYTKDTRGRDRVRRTLLAFGRLSLPIGKTRTQRFIEATRILSLPVGRWKLKAALDRFGLLYRPSGDGKVVSPNGNYADALVGTVALALLTELTYARASGDASFAELRAAWLDGLLGLRIPGGGFRQDPLAIDDADYGNGEAWLALAVHGDMHPDDLRAMNALSDLDDTLIRRYSEKPSVMFLGWGGMAAAQRYRTTHDPKFLAFLRQLSDEFVERFQSRLRAEGNNCAAMEGIASMVAALQHSGEKNTDRMRFMLDWLSSEVAKLEKLQIKPGQQRLPLGGSAYLAAPRMAEYAGGFLAGIYEPLTRVDAAGHCLSAMVIIERNQLL